jgi:acetyl esterase/lipase
MASFVYQIHQDFILILCIIINQLFMEMNVTNKKLYRLLVVFAFLVLGACEHGDIFDPRGPGKTAHDIKPEMANPEWAPNIDPQMLAVIEQLGKYETPPLHTLSPAQARMAPSPTDAVMDLLKRHKIHPSPPKVDVSHQVIPGNTEEGLLVRIYTPKSGDGPFPVIVYYHGGGWVIAGLDTYEPSAMALAEKSKAIVVSVSYRQAPENPFPAAHEDAFAAYKWVLGNAADFNGDPHHVAVAGESAGGNLAVATALMAKDRQVELPLHILAVYPIADGDVQSPTYDEYANALPLNRPLMEWFFDHYMPDWKSETNPLISLVKADLSGLPPTTIINAEIDPLAAEGEELADQLQMAGVEVVREVYTGVTHEFFGMHAVLEQAEEAQDLAVAEIRKSFGY